ncbi:MAG TPA: xanthine permease [Anaerolineaceae bacterium]|nr:MAG: xanthine permease [Chloroflexi bacterium GWB2_54_36]HAL15346.1 xanthine permease [Anaerolineaceae bacterium]HBA91525.1 xanthine permease [Anaerolineaceae bacterium]
MATAAPKAKVMGYLPNDTPPFGQMLLLGLQHVLTMFPATVLAAILMKFPVSTVLTITGLGTVVALVGAKLAMGKYIPLYYGSSFSYIAAVSAVMAAKGVTGAVAPPEVISVATAGFIATGVINIVVGIIIRASGGKEAVDKVLPPVVTGSVAVTIGIGLGAAALQMATGTFSSVFDINALTNLKWITASTITLLAAFILSVYLQGKGFIGMLPILLAAIVGYVVSIPLGLVDFSTFGKEALLRAPQISFPVFNDPLTLTVLVGVGIMAIATIPESTAHLYQISLYVDHLAEEQGKEKYNLSRYIGLNLMLDGLNDLVNGLFGSTAGTNYGENNSLMVITRNYSGPSLITAGIISILLGFIGPLAEAVQSIPTAVSGGLAIYLFGVIGMQGVALMMAEKVNLYDPKQLAIGATVLVIGIGGNIGFSGGFLPIPLFTGVFPYGWPAIATGAVVGILMNLLTLFWKPPMERAAATK